jgi:methyltransferase (TIGR00027 family)
VEGSKRSSTAQGVALVRAHLTEVGRLDDPYAAGLLDQQNARRLRLLGRWPVRALVRGRSFGWLAVRIGWFDETVVAALDAGVRQVVVLGAGYDARAWRFARTGVRFWEVDHPATQADKCRRAPPGGPTYVPLDLVAASPGPPLVQAGFEPGVPSLFVAEGLVMYLEDDELTTLAAGAADVAAPGSHLALNVGVGFDGSGGIVRRLGRLVLARNQEPIRSTVTPDTVTDLLATAGWRVTTVVRGPELGRDLNPGSAVVLAERNGELAHQ